MDKDLKSYFDDTPGLGVLSTADGSGKVNSAVYSRPHIQDDGSAAFIMLDRLSHANIQTNPHAAFLFREKACGKEKKYEGLRLHLTRLREETDPKVIDSYRRRCDQDYGDQKRFLVSFKVDKVLPLLGAEE